MRRAHYRSAQNGSALVMVIAGIVALVAMGGLALDVGHLTLNKARLQVVVDSAALAAAKTLLDQGGSAAAMGAATTAANDTFALNVAAYPELQQAMSNGLTVSTQFSNTVTPFAAGTTPPNFVRVQAQNFSMLAGLARSVGINTLATGATAVAGPQGVGPQSGNGGTVCGLMPVMMCGDPAAGAPLYGYSPGQLVALKYGAGTSPDSTGPGNYRLIRLNGNGANVVRDNMAGSYENCLSDGDNLETQPGNEAGPVRQGLNTRFNEYLGSMSRSDFPPDVVTTEPNPALNLNCPMNPMQGTSCTIQQGNQTVTQVSEIGYSHSASYLPRLPAGPYNVQPAPGGDGVFKRREVAVPIANCAGAAGQSSLDVLGFACMFLLQRVQGVGSESNIFGEIISSCNSGGVGGAPGGAGGAPSLSYRIVLYNDVGSADS